MKRLHFIIIICIFLCFSGNVYGIGEKTISLGGSSAWKNIDYKLGVTEIASVRPYPVLVLSSRTGSSVSGYSAVKGTAGNFLPLTESSLDLSMTFDEKETGLFRDSTGRYKVSILQTAQAPAVAAVSRQFARAGTGAVLFNGSDIPASNGAGPLLIEPRASDALFRPGGRIGDFSIEFWIYPLILENGEKMFSWVSSVPSLDSKSAGKFTVQRINCVSVKNRLQWSFENFFTFPGGANPAGQASYLDIRFSGESPLIPKTWSHHLVRFDSETGMIEYIVDGVTETILYAASPDRKIVFAPAAGNDGVFVLGERYIGLMDELKIHSACVERDSLQKYISSGGRAQTAPVDLGENNGGVIKVDVSGGKTSIRGISVNNEFRSNGRFRFSDDSEMQFFIRAADNRWRMDECKWISFVPGEEIQNIRGRYVQIAVDFYPSADGETSPYLDELRIVYQGREPPLPPGNLTAAAVDGGVLLRWKQSPDAKTAGYLVYYSAVRGEYFGEDAVTGPSPIDAGKRNSLLIEGLNNGTLYYFRVAAYDRAGGMDYGAPGSVNYNTGEFSGEVTGRPLAGLSRQALEE
ncbi:MAG: fibronectin type III domain-containing protein [Treponema sp.]|nr:fibronectin type III domain-containing protein [Treponema sp.]